MKIPTQIIAIFERETENLNYGQVSITALFRGGRPRFLINRQLSILPDEEINRIGGTSGESQDIYPNP